MLEYVTDWLMLYLIYEQHFICLLFFEIPRRMVTLTNSCECLLSAYYMPSTTLSLLQALLYLIVITILRSGYFTYAQFKDEQLNFGEFQQFPKVIQLRPAEQGLKFRQSDSKARTLKFWGIF